MMTSFILRLHTFFGTRKRVLFPAAAFLFLCFAFGASRLKLEEDVSAFFPRSRSLNEAAHVLANMKAKDKIVLALTGRDAQAIAKAAQTLCDSLTVMDSGLVRHVDGRTGEGEWQGMYDFYLRHLPGFLDSGDYAGLERVLEPENIERKFNEGYRAIISPAGALTKHFFLIDPLGLARPALERAGTTMLDTAFSLHEGFIFTKDLQTLMVFVTPSAAALKAPGNEILTQQLKALADGLEKTDSVNVYIYGAPVVASGNAVRIKADSLLATLLALVLILSVLFVFFRKLSTLLMILAPVVAGALFALFVLSLFKTGMSVLALSAGSIILGIAINYPLHYYAHLQHAGSPSATLRDISYPMMLGCATTALAFLSLVFTRSGGLHDFGLFVGLSLAGTLLFTLLLTPQLHGASRKGPTRAFDATLHGLSAFRPERSRWLLALFVLLTVFFFVRSFDVRFESDMMRMNYESPETKEAAHFIGRATGQSLRSVFLAAKGPDAEQALRNYERLKPVLDELREAGVVTTYRDLGALVVSDSLQQRRLARWRHFMTADRRNVIRAAINEAAQKRKFRNDAFVPFLNLLDSGFYTTGGAVYGQDRMPLEDFIVRQPGYAAVVIPVKVDETKKDALFDAFAGDPTVLVADARVIAAGYASVAREDFNRILWMVAVLVFGCLLLAYGRIELALINFLPMVISWIWILGLMASLGIPFNIVNIVIATFIFGLGDDYSIFMMNALTGAYRTGVKKTALYKLSILISTLLITIGIASLLVARHPALQSIAVVTMAGMLIVPFVSFLVQPLAFETLILSRQRKKQMPYTLSTLLITGMGFVAFAAGCLLLTLLAMALFLWPSKKFRRYCMTRSIMYLCRLMLILFVNVRKKTVNRSGERFDRPAIIVSNHQSHIDLGLLLRLHPDMAVLTNDWAWNFPFYRFIVRAAQYYPVSKGFETNLPRLRELFGDGYSILVFPEGTRSVDKQIHRFHKGAFLLAQELHADILPVVIHGSGDCLTKGDFHFKEGRLTVHILPRITPDDMRFGGTPREKARGVRDYMAEELQHIALDIENGSFYRHVLIKNYMYKGKDIERSLRRELKRYGDYNSILSLIPRRGRICELGCGYGFFSFMMMLTSAERVIEAWDGDGEKISVASHCTLATERIRFRIMDAGRLPETRPDVFVFRNALADLPGWPVLAAGALAILSENGQLILDDLFTNRIAELYGRLEAGMEMKIRIRGSHSFTIIEKLGV